jgi:Tfp pilus assembly protein PilX
MRRPSPRGSALLVAMIALAVLMVLVVGAIQFTGTNQQAAIAKGQGDRVSACAETARRYLLSRLRTFNMPIAGLTLEREVPDAVEQADRSKMLTAHYGQNTPQQTIQVVSSSDFSASQKQVRDLANAAPESATLGGQYYRVVMVCNEPGGRSAETEFVFRHGL